MTTPHDPLTVICEFDIEPEEVQPLRGGIEWLIREVVSKQPGFVSANLYVSRDGQKALNCLRWESLEAFERFRDDDAKQSTIRVVIGPYGPRSRVYDIVLTAMGPQSRGRAAWRDP